MSTGLIIVIVVAVVIVLALVILAASRSKQRRLDGRRDEARQIRREAQATTARADSAEAEANERDAVLGSVPEEQRATLVAQARDDALEFDVHLQGDRQTAFFSL